MSQPAYTEQFIQGQTVKLHYLDWGGTGEPLILIHGLGDTPYLFEGLAALLKKQFRVIAYSKRGHCKTETYDSNYEIAALVSDLKLLLDSLNISKANLLGWSIGGNEITEFAIQYPERTNRLIYLEAGYDLSEAAFNLMQQHLTRSPFPDRADLVSLDAYRNWYHCFWYPDIDWNAILESNLRTSTQINPDGSIITIPTDDVSKIILQSGMSYHRNYDKIMAPSLILYTNTFFKAARNDSASAANYKNLEKEIINPWRHSSMNRIKTEMKTASIKIIPNGSHVSLIFLSKDEIVESINSFLLQNNNRPNQKTMLTAIHPKLPMRNKAITKEFYIDKLGFQLFGNADHEGYLMVQRDNIQIHFFEFKALDPLENYGQVYIRTDDIDKLYQSMLDRNLSIHPAGQLQTKPWGQKEFSMLDPDNNLLTFGESV